MFVFENPVIIAESKKKELFQTLQWETYGVWNRYFRRSTAAEVFLWLLYTLKREEHFLNRQKKI